MTQKQSNKMVEQFAHDAAETGWVASNSQQRVVSRKGLIHGIAECMECKWRSEDYLTIQKQARAHVVQTGHHVEMELGYRVCFAANNAIKPTPKPPTKHE